LEAKVGKIERFSSVADVLDVFSSSTAEGKEVRDVR